VHAKSPGSDLPGQAIKKPAGIGGLSVHCSGSLKAGIFSAFLAAYRMRQRRHKGLALLLRDL